MRMKDIILQRKVKNGIISEENAKIFMDNAELINGWWHSENRPVYNDITGLGDVVSLVTDKFNIHKCHKCKKRQQKLNKLLPFKGK